MKNLVFGFLGIFLLASCASVNSYTTPEFEGATLKDSMNQLRNSTGSQGKIVAFDLSGEDRDVSETSEWKVCTQSKAAGERSDNSAVIDLGVVSLDDHCPSSGVMAAPKKVKKKIYSDSIPTNDDGSLAWHKFKGENLTDRDIKEIQKKLEIPVTGVYDNATAIEVFKTQGMYQDLKETGTWDKETDERVFKK